MEHMANYCSTARPETLWALSPHFNAGVNWGYHGPPKPLGLGSLFQHLNIIIHHQVCDHHLEFMCDEEAAWARVSPMTEREMFCAGGHHALCSHL